MEGIHFAVQLYLVVDILIDGPSQRRAESSYIHQQQTILAILFFFLAFNTVSMALIGQLIAFHASLQKHNLTTYEYITNDYKTRRAQARLLGDLEAQRVVLMAKAEQEKNRGLACRLQVGGMCRNMGLAACDPLNLPEPAPEPDPEAGFACALGGGDNITAGAGAAWNHAAAAAATANDEHEESYNDDDDTDGNYNELQKSTSNHSRRSQNALPVDHLVDLMYEVGLQAPGNDGPGDNDFVEVDAQDNISAALSSRNQDIELAPIQHASMLEPTLLDDRMSFDNNYDTSFDNSIKNETSFDNDDSNNNDETFDNEPDDSSHNSGCAGRRTSSSPSRLVKSASQSSPSAATTALGERDYTAF
jgi:hypothetical protein